MSTKCYLLAIYIAQDQSHVEKTDDWPTSALMGYHLTFCNLARDNIQGRMGV